MNWKRLKVALAIRKQKRNNKIQLLAPQVFPLKSTFTIELDKLMELYFCTVAPEQWKLDFFCYIEGVARFLLLLNLKWDLNFLFNWSPARLRKVFKVNSLLSGCDSWFWKRINAGLARKSSSGVVWKFVEIPSAIARIYSCVQIPLFCIFTRLCKITTSLFMNPSNPLQLSWKDFPEYFHLN